MNIFILYRPFVCLQMSFVIVYNIILIDIFCGRWNNSKKHPYTVYVFPFKPPQYVRDSSHRKAGVSTLSWANPSNVTGCTMDWQQDYVSKWSNRSVGASDVAIRGLGANESINPPVRLDAYALAVGSTNKRHQCHQETRESVKNKTHLCHVLVFKV